MSHIFLQVVLTLPVAGLTAADLGTVPSPDGTVTAVCALTDGRISYRVAVDGSPVLLDSPLGLELSSGTLAAGLALEKISERKVTRDHYTLTTGKRSDISTLANEQEFSFSTQAGGHLTVHFRVADDGVAFRYVVPVQADHATSAVTTAETTGFALPSAATGWLHPMHRPGGWAKTQPSYEAEYAMNIPVGDAIAESGGLVFPRVVPYRTPRALGDAERIRNRRWLLRHPLGA